MLIGFVLGVAVVCNLWIDGVIVGASVLNGRSLRHEHVFLLDVDCGFIFVERVVDVACNFLHSVGRVFIVMPFDVSFDLCERVDSINACSK